MKAAEAAVTVLSLTAQGLMLVLKVWVDEAVDFVVPQATAVEDAPPALVVPPVASVDVLVEPPVVPDAPPLPDVPPVPLEVVLPMTTLLM